MFNLPESQLQFIALVWKPVVVGAIAGIAFIAFSRLSGGRDYARKYGVGFVAAVLVSVPVTLVAYVAGYLTGVTGSAAIGNLMPAVLALIGGFNVYLFGARVRNRPFSIYALFLFSVILFY